MKEKNKQTKKVSVKSQMKKYSYLSYQIKYFVFFLSYSMCSRASLIGDIILLFHRLACLSWVASLYVND